MVWHVAHLCGAVCTNEYTLLKWRGSLLPGTPMQTDVVWLYLVQSRLDTVSSDGEGSLEVMSGLPATLRALIGRPSLRNCMGRSSMLAYTLLYVLRSTQERAVQDSQAGGGGVSAVVGGMQHATCCAFRVCYTCCAFGWPLGTCCKAACAGDCARTQRLKAAGGLQYYGQPAVTLLLLLLQLY